MLILGPLAAPTISAATWEPPSSSASVTTLSPSTTSRTGSVSVEPTSPVRRSTVRTSSTDAFSCLPPQRTIAYTETLFPLCADPSRFPRQPTGIAMDGLACSGTRRREGCPCVPHRRPERADNKGYQTAEAPSDSRGIGG